MSISPGSANPVEIGLSVFGEIKIDDYVDRLNVNSTSEKIRAHQITADTISKIVKDTIAIMLKHLGVRIEARITEFCNFLCQKFHSICGITENDGLIDLELGEERIKAVYFLLFLHEAIILSDSTKRKFIHEIDLIGIFHVFILVTVSQAMDMRAEKTYLEGFDYDGKSRTKEHDLTFFGMEAQ